MKFRQKKPPHKSLVRSLLNILEKKLGCVTPVSWRSRRRSGEDREAQCPSVPIESSAGSVPDLFRSSSFRLTSPVFFFAFALWIKLGWIDQAWITAKTGKLIRPGLSNWRLNGLDPVTMIDHYLSVSKNDVIVPTGVLLTQPLANISYASRPNRFSIQESQIW